MNSHTTITRHLEDKQSKATSSLFPIKVIAKLEWTQCRAQQNKDQPQNLTMGATFNNKSTTERLRKNGQQPKPLCGWNAFYWYEIFPLDSAVDETQTLLSSHGGFLTIAMYLQRETINQINALWWNKEIGSQLTASQS